MRNGVAEAVPISVTVMNAVEFSAAPVAPAGGVWVTVIVQLVFGLTGVPTAQVPPSAKVPVPDTRVTVMAVGTNRPALAFVRAIVLVSVMVPVTATVLAGVGVSTPAGVIGETLIVATVSWAVSETV